MVDMKAKTADQILGEFAVVRDAFTETERRRFEHTRHLLRRVLTDLELQDELCAEARLQRKGFPPMHHHPAWARCLAEVLRNPDGKFSTPLRRLVYEMGRDLHAEACRTQGPVPLIERLAYEANVPILSDIARQLTPPRLYS